MSSMSSTANMSSQTNSYGIKRGSLVPSSPSTGDLIGAAADKKVHNLRSRLTENLFSSSNDMRRTTQNLMPKRMGVGGGGSNAMDLAASPSQRLQIANTSQIGGGSGQLNVMSMQQLFDPDHEIALCIKFVQCVRKVLAMFNFENKFIGKILDGKSDKITASKMIGRIFDPVLKELLREAERLSSNVRLVGNSKRTSKYIVAVFSVLSDLVEMKADFLKVFEHSALITKTLRHIGTPTQMYLDIFVHLEKAVSFF
jgi:hypothetical protein